jgi:hypothetical protein
MTTRQREKRLQHPQAWLDHAWNEWCLRADRAIDWQYCADRIGLPLNQTLNLGRVLGLVDAKTKAALFKQELNAAMRSCKAARVEHDRRMIQMRGAGASYRTIADRFDLSPRRVSTSAQPSSPTR